MTPAQRNQVCVLLHMLTRVKAVKMPRVNTGVKWDQLFAEIMGSVFSTCLKTSKHASKMVILVVCLKKYLVKSRSLEGKPNQNKKKNENCRHGFIDEECNISHAPLHRLQFSLLNVLGSMIPKDYVLHYNSRHEYTKIHSSLILSSS